MSSYATITIGFFIFLALLSGIKIIRQYDRAVLFTLGKYSRTLQPGLNIVIPLIQSIVVVDIRQRTLDLEPQTVMTKDNVNLTIDGVVFYAIESPKDVILNVENLKIQLEQKSSSELKEIVSSMDMTEALGKREQIALKLMKEMEKAVADVENAGQKQWGIKVRGIQINNVELPQNLVRAMAKEAEASREKIAIQIRSEGENEAAQNYLAAANKYASNPAALRLRELKTYEEIGKEQNTLMLVIPSEASTESVNTALSAAAIAKTEK
jgi:regulator of protease activity HflC (stomatin/prohibitin superfamily)